MIFKNAENSSPILPDPLEFGWKLATNGNYQPLINSKPPSPEPLVELIMCNHKTDCST